MEYIVSSIRHWFKAYATFWRTLPQPPKLLSPNWHGRCVSKRPFFHSVKPTASGWWGHGKTMDSMILGPLSHFYGCEVSSLVRNNTVQSTVMLDKTFFKSTDDGFSQSIMYRKAKSIPWISIYSIRTKPSPQRKWSNVIRLPLAHWLVTPGNGAISRARCWSLLLAAVVIARSALVNGSHAVKLMHNPPSLSPCPFWSWSH